MKVIHSPLPPPHSYKLFIDSPAQFLYIQGMKPKYTLIVILLIIAAAGLVYDKKINGRRTVTVTRTTGEITIATSTAPVNIVPPTTKPKKKTVTIGVILPLTGSQATYGQWVKEGLDLAVKGVNSTKTFSLRVNLVYEDTRSDVKNAPTAVRKLIDRDNVAALISVLSPTSLAVAPIAQESKTVLLTMASLASQLNSAGDFIFKNDDTSTKIGIGLADAARAKDVTSIGILLGDYNDDIVESATAFTKRFIETGGTVTGTETFSAIQKLIAQKPTSIAVFGLHRDCAIAVKNIRESGFTGPIFGNTCFDDPIVLADAGSAIEGATFVSYNLTPSEKFIALVKKEYGHTPLHLTAEAFDGLKLLALALAKSMTIEGIISSVALRDTLTTIAGYTGEAGRADFDKEGNASRKLYVKTVKNGVIETVK